MSRVCQVTGKKPALGNNVSHANNKTRRRFLPNLHYRRIWVESENRWVSLRVSQAGLRTSDKKGIDVVLAELRARGDVLQVDRSVVEMEPPTVWQPGGLRTVHEARSRRSCCSGGV